jgi:hypothetical protein
MPPITAANNSEPTLAALPQVKVLSLNAVYSVYSAVRRSSAAASPRFAAGGLAPQGNSGKAGR